MSELLEVATWLVYVSAAIMMLGAIVAAVLAGFAVRFVAVVLREIIYSPARTPSLATGANSESLSPTSPSPKLA